VRAVQQLAYGVAPELVDDVPVPSPGKGEVLVRVRAAGLNAADWFISSGEPLILRLAFGLGKPRLSGQGRDVAGTVEALGAGVTGLAIGDAVYGEIANGALADFAVAPARLLSPMPASLTFEQAAVVALSGNTALQGLRELARLQPGQTVLVNGASGGVGTFAVQIAKALGAHVTGVSSAANHDLVLSLGADAVIDYRTVDFTATGTRYDVIFDLVANHSLREYRRALTTRGVLVLSAGTGSKVLGPIGRLLRAAIMSLFIRQRLAPHAATRSSDRLVALTELIDSGAVRPALESVISLAESPAAIVRLGTGRVRGKIAVRVAGEEVDHA
jgi:NADPH:quinone reductase-like Zn-dependent oxidoreductase